MKLKVKGVFMYPELTTKINILAATDITTKNGRSYVNVVFTDDRGNPRSMYFPSEFSDFAKSNLGKVVTAVVRFWPPFNDKPANLSGVALR